MTPARRKYVLDCLVRYWGEDASKHIESLPVLAHGLPENISAGASGIKMILPDWAYDTGVDGSLLVPDWAAMQAGNRWEMVDWLAVCFWYLHNCAERKYEQKNGAIHSYSYRLKGFDEFFWQHAWVNRIALFLRRWAAHLHQIDEVVLFGAPPRSNIWLTHDVDAISKTFAIRIKQTLFHAYNAFRLVLRGRTRSAARRFSKALRFFFSNDDYWCFDRIIELEEQQGVKSTFNLYAGKPGNERSYKERLFDPAYNVNDSRLRQQLRQLSTDGWTIGLHPSFDAWADEARLRWEKCNLEGALGEVVTVCRQHWLRFSFEKTWKTQQGAGLKLDTTLGFNDRPGFRNSAALMIQPWDESCEAPIDNFSILPMVLMDAHLYDYQPYSNDQRLTSIRHWIREIKAVGGEATIIWHQRVMGRDYGWAEGYRYLLNEVCA